MFAPDYYADDFPEYDVIKGFANYGSSALVEIEALQLHRERPFRAVIALDESDIIRAARIRERLGLPGQRVESAVAFRDKVVMKSLLAPHVKCPPFRRLEHGLDLYDFVEQHGLPVVVKPVDGMGSLNTTVVRTEEQLTDLYRSGRLRGLMVEAFVPGEMYEIDGLIADGEIKLVSVGQYGGTCLDFQQNLGLYVHLLAPQTAMYKRLRALTEQVLQHLPTPALTSFHAEVFHTPDDELVFCEIASRTAGGRIAECVRQFYGVDLDEAWSKLACGVEVPLPEKSELAVYTAVYLIPKQIGRLEKMIEEFPFDWVTEYQPRIKAGMDAKGTLASADTAGSVVFQATDEAELEQRFQQLLAYVDEQIVWRTEPETEAVV